MVKTMSEVIREESVVVRIGCLAGPNLAKEMSLRQPGATVVASPFLGSFQNRSATTSKRSLPGLREQRSRWC
ncbi:MAG: hypothetical protein WDO15_18585 [Bacteroidota bacterium]